MRISDWSSDVCSSDLLAARGRAALAQDAYPSHPLIVTVPYAPGGQGDVFARLLGERLGAALKQTVVVENRPGASGTVGTRPTGRASGRERVCRYVLIPVVAVS